MVAKEFRLLDLGKYIYLESEIEYRKRKLPIYQKRDHKEPKSVNYSLSGSSKKPSSEYNDKQRHVFLYDSYDKKKEYLPYEDYLRRKRMEKKDE